MQGEHRDKNAAFAQHAAEKHSTSNNLNHRIKEYVYKNAALCDRIADIQAKINIIQNDRSFLIERLLLHEGVHCNITTRDASNEIFNPDMSGSQPMRPKDDYIFNENLVVHHIGEVLHMNPNFHTQNWIYPAGYTVSRAYAHPKMPHRRAVFTCKILNNAGAPKFQLIPDDDLDNAFFGESAKACYHNMLRAIENSLKGQVKLPLQDQGEIFFGLGEKFVQKRILSLPDANRCVNFKCFTPQNKITLFCDTEDPTLNYNALKSLISENVQFLESSD